MAIKVLAYPARGRSFPAVNWALHTHSLSVQYTTDYIRTHSLTHPLTVILSHQNSLSNVTSFQSSKTVVNFSYFLFTGDMEKK